MCFIGLTDPGCRIEVHAHRSFVIGMDRHALQTQFPPSTIELRNGPQLQLPSLHSVLITAAAANPIATIATQINGHSTTTQKEILQSEFFGVGFLFMPLSQAFEDRHFREREISSAILGRGGRIVPRRAAFFPYLATIFRRSGSDSTSCDHGLPFIIIR
jgi:hypothetical protein